MSQQHTKAPWVAIRYGDKFGIRHQTDTASGGEFCTVEPMHWTEEARETARANALLIAAAPDLLAALKFVAKFEAMQAGKGKDIFPGQLSEAIYNAIAKAKDGVA